MLSADVTRGVQTRARCAKRKAASPEISNPANPSSGIVSRDPVTLSVLSHALSGIAEEMGAVLIRGAYSSNIKERRDCSTALFDKKGRMIAQAECFSSLCGMLGGVSKENGSSC